MIQVLWKDMVGSWDRADMLMVTHVSKEVLSQHQRGWKVPLDIAYCSLPAQRSDMFRAVCFST